MSDEAPWEQVLASGPVPADCVAEWNQLGSRLDPFELSQRIEQKLADIHDLANPRQSPHAAKTRGARAVAVLGYILMSRRPQSYILIWLDTGRSCLERRMNGPTPTADLIRRHPKGDSSGSQQKSPLFTTDLEASTASPLS